MKPARGRRARSVVFRLGTASGAGTDVLFSLRADLGALKKVVLGRPVQASMDGEVAALDTAKGLLESS